MKLKEVINKSYYGCDSYIASEIDIEKLEKYILHNLDILKEFKGIIVATNYDDISLKTKNSLLWKKYFPNCNVIDIPENRGHSFGSCDLDNALFDFCKENDYEWLCKSASDILLFPELLENNIEPSDFYYYDGIGYGGMANLDFNLDNILINYFFPQTNFYLINVSKTDYLNDMDYVNYTYSECQNLPEEVWDKMFFRKPWGPFPGWACEKFLADCVERNNLSKYHLIPTEKFIKLLEMIQKYEIHDCSHKNIKIEGVCHFHEMDEQIIILE